MILHVPIALYVILYYNCDYAERAIHFQSFIEQRNWEGTPMSPELVEYECNRI